MDLGNITHGAREGNNAVGGLEDSNRTVGHWKTKTWGVRCLVGPVVAAALAESLGKPFPWTDGFFFGDLELRMDLWTTIAGISGFGGRVGTVVLLKA